MQGYKLIKITSKIFLLQETEDEAEKLMRKKCTKGCDSTLRNKYLLTETAA